jgi:DNA (cytosine-5)-methyltransferase 1
MHRIFTQSDAPQNKDREPEYPDMRLYQEIIFLKHFFDGDWCVENVKPYYQPLLPGQVRSRHMFWSNFHIPPISIKKPKKFMNSSTKDDKQELCEWLGMKLEEDPYPRGSHDPCHVLRNCVHPKLGKHVSNAARNAEDQTLRGFVEC